MDWIALVPLLVMVTLVVSVLVWSNKLKAAAAAKEKPIAAQRERRARELGWRYDGAHRGDIRYRFSGTTSQRQAWELRFDSDHSSSSSTPKLIWEAAGLRADRVEFEMSSNRQCQSMQNPTAQKMAAGAARLAGAMGSKSMGGVFEFMKDAKLQTVGSSALRSHWAVVARSARDVARLLDDETETLLLNWPRTVEPKFDPFQNVTVRRDTKGLRIECHYDSTDMPLCEHLVKLGLAMAQRVNQAA
jgi:hypothetical protein